MHVLAQFCNTSTVRIKRDKIIFLENIPDMDEITASAEGLVLMFLPFSHLY
jgi:hypothetical protein